MRIRVILTYILEVQQAIITEKGPTREKVFSHPTALVMAGNFTTGENVNEQLKKKNYINFNNNIVNKKL